MNNIQQDYQNFFNNLPPNKQEALKDIDLEEALKLKDNFNLAKEQIKIADLIIKEQEWVKKIAQKILDEIIWEDNVSSDITSKDVEIIEKIKSENPELYSKIYPKLLYWYDYIQIDLPKSWILKIDRKDLWNMNWNNAMDIAQKLWKRLITIEEWEELVEFVWWEETQEIFWLESNYYWTSNTNTDYTTNASYINLKSSNTYSSNKTNIYSVICTR